MPSPFPIANYLESRKGQVVDITMTGAVSLTCDLQGSVPAGTVRVKGPVLRCDPNDDDRNLTLPPASKSVQGVVLYILQVGSDTDDLTVLDDSTTVAVLADGESVKVLCDGTEWLAIP